MEKKLTDFWNERYKDEIFAYGKKANEYLISNIQNLKSGKILFPCDGEGRNSVFSSENGFESYAFDISIEGKKKALKLSDEKKVKINFDISSLDEFNFKIILVFLNSK